MRLCSSLLLSASLLPGLSLLVGCGGLTEEQGCGVAACVPDDPQAPTPAPDGPSEPRAPSAPSTPEATCTGSLEDGFEGGVWSPRWSDRGAPGPTREGDDRMEVAPLAEPGAAARSVLSVFGEGAADAYAAAAGLSFHTECFASRARFAFDYRLDEGPLDASREDHAEIAEITALGPTGVRCAVLVHVREGRLSATTGPRIDLGSLPASTWTRLELRVEGSDVSFARDGQDLGSLPMGCVASEGTVRVSVSGGRSFAPGRYRAYFDDVRIGAAPAP